MSISTCTCTHDHKQHSPVADDELARLLAWVHVGQGHVARVILLVVDQGVPV